MPEPSQQLSAAPPPRRASLPGDPLARFNVAFALMSIIPLLICMWLITARFFSLDILGGVNGAWMFVAVCSAIIGLWAGRQAIQRIIAQLAQANAKLAKLHATQAQFVHNVAHEFRSPLAIVKGAMDNLSEGLHGRLTTDQTEPVAICQRQVNRLARLVGDLLDLAQIESGKIRLVEEEFVLQELIRPVVESFGVLAKSRGLALTMELPASPVRMRGDCDRLSQVLTNLISNSLKFTQHGSVRVELVEDASGALITVSDTGRGIAPEDLERIFEKFERAGSADQEGSGLGLPIARNIVELHRGRLWAESALGRGSRFLLRLPAAGQPARRR